jgi:hypothetical protein
MTNRGRAVNNKKVFLIGKFEPEKDIPLCPSPFSCSLGAMRLCGGGAMSIDDAISLERRTGDLDELFGPYEVKIRLDRLTEDLSYDGSLPYRGESRSQARMAARNGVLVLIEGLNAVAERLQMPEALEVSGQIGMAPQDEEKTGALDCR